MGADPISEEEQHEVKRQISRPRPGHADLTVQLNMDIATYEMCLNVHLLEKRLSV